MKPRVPPYGKRTLADMARSICASSILHLLLFSILCSASPSFVVTGAQTRFDIVWATGRSSVSHHTRAKTATDSATTLQPAAEPVTSAGRETSAAHLAPAESSIDVVLLSAVDLPGARPAPASTAPGPPRPRPAISRPAPMAHRQTLPKKVPIASGIAAPPSEPPQAITVAVAAPDEAGIPGETDADDDGDEEQSEPPEADSARRLPPPKAANSVPPARGAIVKALQGDLKLVIEGDSGIKVSVSFRDYPKARRTRISGSEARRDRAVAPALAATREDTREAVIETTQEGVYTFRVASEGGKGARANFILKIYEAGLRGRTANLGGRTISGSTVLLKILMPEAVLWDDDSAFTGSMEDSESETRYNATTGLYWKEYRD